jgi:hypothetical protein
VLAVNLFGYSEIEASMLGTDITDMRPVARMIFMAQLLRRASPTRLRLERGFGPCPVDREDEIYANGIFEFNVTRLLAFVQEHVDRFPVEQVETSEFPEYGDSSHLNEETICLADLTRPILLAEIAPWRYNVIDGNHRLAKARREGVASLPAYRLRCPAHVPFLTSAFAYERYVEYWNEKIRTLREANRFGRPPPSGT